MLSVIDSLVKMRSIFNPRNAVDACDKLLARMNMFKLETNNDKRTYCIIVGEIRRIKSMLNDTITNNDVVKRLMDYISANIADDDWMVHELKSYIVQ